jgi:hypothetical protein
MNEDLETGIVVTKLNHRAMKLTDGDGKRNSQAMARLRA